MTNSRKPGLVGQFIRTKREALGLSQRGLGLKFTPPVTTQFISNVERGVTPLPPAHIPTLIQALQVTDSSFLEVMEREYAIKLSGKLGVDAASVPSNGAAPSLGPLSNEARSLLESLSRRLSQLALPAQLALIQKIKAVIES